METYCLLKEREYEIILFDDYEKSFEKLRQMSKYTKKILFNLGDLEINPKFLSYMLKLFRYSIENNFEIFFINNNKNLNDNNIIEAKRYFKIFSSIEEYNLLKTYARFEVKIYDDNKHMRNLLKDELLNWGFGIKERNSLNFLKKNHDAKSNSIYIVDFDIYQDEKIEEVFKIKNKNKDAIVVLICFEDNIDNALKTIKYGVNTVLKKPIDVKELVTIIKNIAIQAELKRENEELNEQIYKREQEITKLYNALNEELKLASDIQKSIMPPNHIIFNNYKIDYLFIPSMNIGGDFCDFIKLSKHRFAVVFADISGHGIPASLLSSMLKVFIQDRASKTKTITELMEDLNEEIIKIFPKGKFVSLFYLVIDTDKNDMIYCKASQESGLMYKNEEKEIIELETEGQILGLFSKKIFPIIKFEEKKIDFKLNDKVLLYTDGITEALNSKDEFFGLDRLKKYINLELEEIEKKLRKFLSFKSLEDDLTLLKIERIK